MHFGWRTGEPMGGIAGSGPGPAAISGGNFNVSNLLRFVRRGRAVFAVCAGVGLLVGAVAAFLPRHYTAVSRVQVRPGSSSQYRLDKSDLLGLGEDSTKLETETLILESDTLLLDTAKKLRLEQNSDFMGSVPAKPERDGAKAEEKLLARLHENIHTMLIPRTEIMRVSCESRSGMLSARVVNTLVAEYIQHLFESRFSSTQRVTHWLSGQLDDLKEQVEGDEERLIQIQSRLGIVGLDQTHDIVVTELEDLTKAADEARAERIVAEARYRILSSGDLNLLEGGQDVTGRTVASSSPLALLNSLRTQKAQIEARYAGLNSQFGARYPEVQQAAAELATVNREIQQEQARVLNQAQQAYGAATKDEQSLFATLGAKKNAAFEKRSEMVQYQILLHDYESNRTLYEGLLQRLRQAGIVAGLESSEVDIVDLARVPGRPSELGRPMAVGLGLFAGLVAGVLIQLLLLQFDQRLHDLGAIESQMGLPLLSITTKLSKAHAGKKTTAAAEALASMPEVFRSKTGSAFVESMWSLREALLLSTPGKAPQTILFTSCHPGEGKSTLACAQACALSMRQAKVLLIDGDMRRPTVMRRFGLKNKVGLSSLLTGSTTVEEAIQSVDGMPNLSIIASGPLPPSAALILSAEVTGGLLRILRERYDFIVIDSPPLLGLADASTLAQFADAVVVVLSFTSLHRGQIQRAIQVLQRVGRFITGIALNFADPLSLDEYGYGYSDYETAAD